MLRCHCFAHLRGLMLCIIMTTAAAAADVPAPPVPPAPPSPPTPTRFVPQHSQVTPVSQPLPPPMHVYGGPFDPGGPHFTMDSAPQTQYCPDLDFANRCHRGSGLLGSDAYAGSATDEALPECHPLPCLVEVRWRNEPVTPEFAAPSPSAPAASECTPSLGLCFPNADKIGQGPACLDVQAPPAGPAPVQTARHIPGRPPVPHVVRVAAAAPESPHPLTPVQHLQKAADHLEAAGHPDEAQHLRERAADLQRHARQRLQELREHKRKIEEEIDELQRMTGTFDQVQIRVSMLEVDEQKLKESGIDFEVPTAMKSADGAPLPPTQQPLIAFDLRPAKMASAQLRALRECAAAKVLAEPVVVTTDGREATMFSGGDFPILIPQLDGSIGVEHQECGVRLTTTPQILEDGRLRLDIASDVSVRDFQRARVVDGHTVPGVIRRRFNAQVVTRFGETLVIGGLSQRTQTSPVAEMLRKIPYQNQLFRPVSDTVAAEGSVRSLVVFVTAEPVPTAAQIPGH